MKLCQFLIYVNVIAFEVQSNERITLPVASGGGGTPERSPSETGKIVVEIWCYLPEVYTFGAESEIQEIFSKKL